MRATSPPKPPAVTLSLPETGSPVVRAAGLLALLAVEVLAVSLPNWWPKLVGEGRYALQVVLTVGLTTAVFAGGRLRHEAAVLGRALHRSVFPWRLMACQLGAYLVFAV